MVVRLVGSGATVIHDWFKIGSHSFPSLIQLGWRCELGLPFVPYIHPEKKRSKHNNNSNLLDVDNEDQDQPESVNYLSCKQLYVETEVIMHTNVPLEDKESANTSCPKNVFKLKVKEKAKKTREMVQGR